VADSNPPPADTKTASRSSPPLGPAAARDPYIDFLRAVSLLVVVAWHWAFTIVRWRDDGPHATSPIGFTTGLWLATWLFQVMPLFFYVGGYSHLSAWQRARARGDGLGRFVTVRLRRLAVPALTLLAVWITIGIVLTATFDAQWVWRAVKLVVSPLWFMGVYLMLVALLPVFLWLHHRFDTIVLVWMAAVAAGIDIVRFRYDHPWVGLVNMVVVWGLCHQLGFFYQRFVAAHRRVDWTLFWAGLAGLGGLVLSGLYPGSMVGVPGETSNMAPPTLCIVALVLFQAGVAEVIRPSVARRLPRPRWQRVSTTMNRFSMPLFLFHTTGMALYKAVRYGLAGQVNEAREPSLGWWLMRPVSVIGPLLFTLPVILLFGRQWTKRPQPGSA
jgi:peptidoglycan/LPS O-acetylase OafA/YrhL